MELAYRTSIKSPRKGKQKLERLGKAITLSMAGFPMSALHFSLHPLLSQHECDGLGSP